jgi:hypothetical protein
MFSSFRLSLDSAKQRSSQRRTGISLMEREGLLPLFPEL